MWEKENFVEAIHSPLPEAHTVGLETISKYILLEYKNVKDSKIYGTTAMILIII